MNWLTKDKNFIWHPFTPQKQSPDPVFIHHAKGSWLYDENNKKYLDAISSWWVNLHGHAHPYIAERLYEQALKLEHIIFAGFTHQPAIELAEMLLPLLPGSFDKIFYSDNGSTSTEVALKMAMQFWWNTREKGQSSPERKKILAFQNSYHGDTFGAMSVSERSVFTLAFQDYLFEVLFIETPNETNISTLKGIVSEHGPEIAAFIYEPLVQGAGGLNMYEPEWLNEILKTAKKEGVICIADEVMTGFGRTGKLFASEYITEKPDIICLSKGLTGGVMPLGVTACSRRIYEAFLSDDKKKTFFHGHSYTANPMACTAALASLELLLKSTTQDNIQNICRYNRDFLEILKKNYLESGRIKNPRMLGTILAFEINQGEDIYLNEISTVITRRAMEKEVYLRPLGNTVYFMPPYSFTEEEYKQLRSVTEEIINFG